MAAKPGAHPPAGADRDQQHHEVLRAGCRPRRPRRRASPPPVRPSDARPAPRACRWRACGRIAAWRPSRYVAIGPPIRPPATMPTIAADTASVAAPLTPALLEQRREREPGGGPAGQRHRAGEHAHQRVLAEQPRHAGADDVLQRRRDRRDDHHHEHERTATREHAKAGAEADRREERVLQRHLQRGVEGDERRRSAIDEREEGGDRQPADDRRGNVVARQHRHCAS